MREKSVEKQTIIAVTLLYDIFLNNIRTVSFADVVNYRSLRLADPSVPQRGSLLIF